MRAIERAAIALSAVHDPELWDQTNDNWKILKRDEARAAVLAFLEGVDVEAIDRAVCAAGGGDPDALMDNYLRSPDSEEIQYDKRWFDMAKGKDRYQHKFWRQFGTERRAVLSALRAQAGETE